MWRKGLGRTRVEVGTLVQRLVQRDTGSETCTKRQEVLAAEPRDGEGVDRSGHMWGRADRVVAEDKGIKTAPGVLT